MVGNAVSDELNVIELQYLGDARVHVIVKELPAGPDVGLMPSDSTDCAEAGESGARATNNPAAATEMPAKRPTLRTARTPVHVPDLVERPGPNPDRCSIPPRSALPQPGVFPWDVSSPPRLLS
ncbi:hypothetical protein Aglo03_63610 [Actinokineospora globicatena]|uniref:Uncharacterized protein n=1 Tax=Actinokineospora globicatena TaxID=103729 RepID=A0A9W6QVB2_9PSEU|nr:hypothetical protein Aglo03_63610 [Actinokineospora globicatena]